MAKERIHNLPQTRGNYQITGIINGTKAQGFYTEKKTKTNKDFRRVNFGVEYDNNKTVYIDLNGMPKDKVYFSKTTDGKTATKSVDWENRMQEDPDGYRLIGVRLGLTKTTNDKGKEVNNVKMMTEYDACRFIRENLNDDDSVFVKGNLDFSNYFDNKGDIRRSIKYVPNQISLCQEVDFNKFAQLEKDDQNSKHGFKQRIIYMGIDQEKENDRPTGRFVLSAKIVNYNDIVDAEFIVTTKARAMWFKKNMKPYWAIDIGGVIEVSHKIQEEESDDPFDKDPLEVITNPSKIELIIVSRNMDTLDKETYSEKEISDAIKKINAVRKAEANFAGGSEPNDEFGWKDNDSNADGGFDEEIW